VRLDTEAEVTWRPFDVMGRWVDAKALLPGVGLMWAYVAVAAALVAYEAVATSAEARDRGLLGRWERYQLFYFRLLNSSQVVVTLLVNAVLRVVYAPMRMEAAPPEEGGRRTPEPAQVLGHVRRRCGGSCARHREIPSWCWRWRCLGRR
jgi:hypothetical protein